MRRCCWRCTPEKFRFRPQPWPSERESDYRPPAPTWPPLAGAGLVRCERQGRSRLYRLAGPEVAHAIEALGAIAPIRRARTLNESSQLAALRVARTCYDHLAGRLGVAVFDALVAREALLELTVAKFPARRTRSGLGSASALTR